MYSYMDPCEKGLDEVADALSSKLTQGRLLTRAQDFPAPSSTVPSSPVTCIKGLLYMGPYIMPIFFRTQEPAIWVTGLPRSFPAGPENLDLHQRYDNSERVQRTRTQDMQGFYFGRRNSGFAKIPCIWVLGPLQQRSSHATLSRYVFVKY